MPLVCLILLHYGNKLLQSTLNNLSYLCRLKIVAIVCDVPAHLFACKGCSALARLDALDSLALKLHAVLADGTVA